VIVSRLEQLVQAILLASAALLGGCATIASAPPLQFVDRTYVAPKTWTDTTISYEGYLAPPIFLYDDQPAQLDALTQRDAAASARGFRLFVTPAFIVRQLTDSSSAVRTPSFNPRIAFDYYWLTALDQRLQAHMPKFDRARIVGLRLTIAHHSNGQAGCFLEGQAPAKQGSFEADDCTPPPATGTLRTNRADGDFSTTFLSFLAHGTWLARAPGQRTPWSAGLAVSYDWELPKASHFPGVLPDIERQFYGSWRARVQGDAMRTTFPSCADSHGWCWLRGRARVTAMYEWAPRHLGPLASRLGEPIPHFRDYADASYTFDALHNVGVFVRRVDGQDYYNIGFVHRRRATLAGLVMDLGGYEFK
jgi:hypothetical protein